MTEYLSGWQDILIKVPNDWEMVFEKKKPKKQKKETGYFGFRDSNSKKLEIRWAKFEKPPLNDKIIENYKKSLKKQHKDINIKSEGSSDVYEHHSRYLYWELKKENFQGYLMVWCCVETSRLIICQSQFLIKESSKEKPRITEIISNINCHSKKPFVIWTAPNLQVYSPPEMKIVKRAFLIGLSFIQLHNLSDNFDLLAYRLGLAKRKVKNFDELPEWFKEYYKKNLPGIFANYNPGNFEKLLFDKKKEIWCNLQEHNKKVSISSAKNFYKTYIWLNTEKNDIYCIIYAKKKPPGEEVQDLFDKMTKIMIKNN
ncbi:MAG: hypothetical protein ACW967_11340 [Candidatus Hodarchaeales archaeon]|jgi:hypothetical protein